jgi:hypothetical protein
MRKKVQENKNYQNEDSCGEKKLGARSRDLFI